ncbi:hydroxysqualene dehydroxylase HpnE [Saccharopolyspora rectivirgula]|uniref:hydroxysqualene dehydroxylase HpnE n=1 Tax=Saccharopolyspora rectivirgula TaxID=28042 RepID=UPI0004015332|nr:hydroxysqualene dehydroxylase HpnE [Saccharopolyspora rectivirgula]
MSRGQVVVIGGGLAGISAALRCADNGFTVTLLEARSRLGGATYSFQRGELEVDTGQHVFLRCYRNYRGLLDRLGVSSHVSIQPRFHIPVLAPRGRRAEVRRWNLPAPWHLLPALLGYRLLTVGERIGVARAAWAMRKLPLDDPELDRTSFADWLRAHGQHDRAVDLFWGLLAVAALNASPRQASMALAARVFRTGVLDETDSADIGIPQVPLSKLHGEPAHRELTASGVRVLLRCKVTGMQRGRDGLRVCFRERSGTSTIDADWVVVAVPHWSASRLLAGHGVAGREEWAQLSSAPIINVHVWYDRPVTDLPVSAVVDSPVQWVFDRTEAAGAGDGQYLVLSISAAQPYLHQRAEQLQQLFLPALEEIFPAARRAEVRDFFVSREPNATFLQAPGVARLRPGPHTEIPGLLLAGAWTATGFPDTTEGAVMSGLRAAEAVDLEQRSARGVEVTA